MTNLRKKHCIPCEGNTSPLNTDAITELLKQLNNWEVITNGKEITRHFSFKNFYHTMTFVNAIAWIANQENHHPDLEIGYNYCRVRYSTHAIGGLTENDFICATKVDALFTAPQETVCAIKS